MVSRENKFGVHVGRKDQIIINWFTSLYLFFSYDLVLFSLLATLTWLIEFLKYIDLSIKF